MFDGDNDDMANICGNDIINEKNNSNKQSSSFYSNNLFLDEFRRDTRNYINKIDHL